MHDVEPSGSDAPRPPAMSGILDPDPPYALCMKRVREHVQGLCRPGMDADAGRIGSDAARAREEGREPRTELGGADRLAVREVRVSRPAEYGAQRLEPLRPREEREVGQVRPEVV